MVRRDTKLRERLTPCQCCGYPISERHHILEFAEFGETQYTRQFCANCHELFHIIDRCFRDMDKNPDANTRSLALLDAIARVWDKDDPRIVYLVDLVKLARQGRQEERHTRLPSRVFETFIGG